MPKHVITSLTFDLKDPQERKQFIKVLMDRHGVTLQDLANENNVVHSLITSVVAGQKKSKRMQAAIARRLEVDPHILWPDDFESSSDTPPE